MSLRRCGRLSDMCTTMTMTRAAQGARFAVTMGIDDDEARELNAVAGILEALAIGRAPAFEAVAIEALRGANRRFRQSGSGTAVAIADHDLHRRLSEPCGDERLLATLAPVRRGLCRLRTALAPDPGDVARAADEHDAIIDALERGDHATAAQRLREHVAGGLAALLAAAQ
jgi:DNA-binding GntR family transcriptional regulator